MNFRDYKNLLKGGIYHVYNRGNNKKIIFHDPDDYTFFTMRLYQNLSLIPIETGPRKYTIKSLPPGSFELIGYCLMPNHFHILIKQNTDLSLTVLMSKLCTSYSKYFNKKYDGSGTLFQDQFKAVPITKQKQLEHLMLYVYENPVKAGLINNAKNYPYCKMVPIMQIC
jgi:putative transposase